MDHSHDDPQDRGHDHDHGHGHGPDHDHDHGHHGHHGHDHRHHDHGHDHGHHDHAHHGHDDEFEFEETVERLIRVAVDEPRAEIVRTRIRFRVLYDMMAQRDREFAREFGRRYREAMSRDFEPLWDQLVIHDAAAYAAEHAEWLAADEQHTRTVLGNELFEELEREWDAWRASSEQQP